VRQTSFVSSEKQARWLACCILAGTSFFLICKRSSSFYPRHVDVLKSIDFCETALNATWAVMTNSRYITHVPDVSMNHYGHLALLHAHRQFAGRFSALPPKNAFCSAHSCIIKQQPIFPKGTRVLVPDILAFTRAVSTSFEADFFYAYFSRRLFRLCRSFICIYPNRCTMFGGPLKRCIAFDTWFNRTSFIATHVSVKHFCNKACEFRFFYLTGKNSST